MGWCSATEIMDAALKAVDDTVTKAYELLGVDPERVTLDDIAPELIDAVRPFVVALAEKLHDGDWDCEEDSAYFERFPQEMLGHSDSEHHAWLLEKVKDTDGDQKWLDALKAHTARTGVQTRGR